MIFLSKFSAQEISQLSEHYSPQLVMDINQNLNEHVEGNENCDTLLHLPYNIFVMVIVDIWKHLKEFKNVLFLLKHIN